MIPKLSGIIPFYRRDFETFRHLKPQEFVLRWAIICNMDWNEKDRPTRFGVAEISNTDLAKYIGWSPSLITKWMPRLLAKNPGFYKEKEGRYICYDFDAYIYNKACTREREIREKRLELERKQLAERKAEFAECEKSLSKEKNAHMIDADISILEKASLDSFKGNSLEIYKVTETYDEKQIRLVNTGLFTESELNELCFCGSGERFINCCAESVAYALPPLSNDEKTV